MNKIKEGTDSSNNIQLSLSALMYLYTKKTAQLHL